MASILVQVMDLTYVTTTGTDCQTAPHFVNQRIAQLAITHVIKMVHTSVGKIGLACQIAHLFVHQKMT